MTLPENMTSTHKGNKKIHLLHLVRSLKIAGAEILLFHYIKSLGTERYEHYVYNFGYDGPIRERLENLGVPVIIGPKRASIKNPIKFIIRFLALLKDLIYFIGNNHIEIIQSHLSHANQLAVVVAKITRIPVFPTVHNTMEFEDRRSRWDPRVYIVKLVNFIIYKLADRIVAVSEEVKKITCQRFRLKDSKIAVVKNGITFDDTVHHPVDLAKEFPESSNKIKLIAVGRLYYQKAIDVLVRAVAEVINSGMNNLFVMVVGDGEEKLQLNTLIQNLHLENHIKLFGIRQNAIRLMEASDLFVMPSRFEGLSIAMIEAMACGLPIIASDAPGIRDHIQNGQNGIIFPVEDYKAMAKCIRQLAEDKKLRIKLSHGAKKSFKKEFDMYRNIKPLEMLIQKFTVAN